MFIEKIKNFVETNNSQAHLCICNTNLINETIKRGIYGFPHAGNRRTKSFWRAVSSMYNIGLNDLIFLYRTNGPEKTCKKIHGPFKIYNYQENPAIYYNPKSIDFPMKIGEETDCKVRFLFESFDKRVFTIDDNYELIKKFETKEIWGYRHPAVMNIGAARKKSVTSFTKQQTLVILDLMKNFGSEANYSIDDKFEKLKDEYLLMIQKTPHSYFLNDQFILQNYLNDEAYLYAFIISAFKNNLSSFSKKTVDQFYEINKEVLDIREFINNTMLETIITTHLQDELDIVLSTPDDSKILFFEIKKDNINKSCIDQTEKYLELLQVIFPQKDIYANIVGKNIDTGIKVKSNFIKKIKIATYNIIQSNPIDIEFTGV